MQTKFIFVTGGVMSGLGKGVVSASISKLLQIIKGGRSLIERLLWQCSLVQGSLSVQKTVQRAVVHLYFGLPDEMC